MSSRPDTAPVPRLGLTREEAAASIGMSIDSFEKYVQPSIRIVRLGSMRLIRVADLDAWLDRNAAVTVKSG